MRRGTQQGDGEQDRELGNQTGTGGTGQREGGHYREQIDRIERREEKRVCSLR